VWVWVGAGVSGIALERTERVIPSVEGIRQGGDSGKRRRVAFWGF